MLKEVQSFLFPLAISLALHAGSILLAETYYGSAQAILGQQQAQRQTTLHARLLTTGKAPATLTRSGDLQEVSLESAGKALVEGLVSLPGPYYFPSNELSRRPQVTMPVSIDYPENAPLVVLKHVVLRLLINEAGDVDKVLVETTNVPSELEILARKAFIQAKFHPGLRGEMPVKSQMLVEITFESENTLPPPDVKLPAR